MRKAARGKLKQGLPVGLDYDQDNQMIITLDEAAREAIGQSRGAGGRAGLGAGFHFSSPST
jgi:hypothetical protein